MKNITKIIVGTVIILIVIILAISFLTICIFKPEVYEGWHMDGFSWAALDRQKGYGEPEEVVAYYVSGLYYEQQGDYKRAIENYDIYSKRIGKRRPEVYARALFYSGKRQESARDYFDIVRSVMISPIAQYQDGTWSYEFLIPRLNRLVSYPYGLPAPFPTEELSQFLNEEGNSFLRSDDHFEDTISFLKGMHDHQQSVDDAKEKILAVLQTKFNSVPENVEKRIRSMTNLRDLKSLVITAESCKSLEEVGVFLRIPSNR